MTKAQNEKEEADRAKAKAAGKTYTETGWNKIVDQNKAPEASRTDQNNTLVADISAVTISNAEGADITVVDNWETGGVGTVIRLVYVPGTGERNVSAVFYDYDISSGLKNNAVDTKKNGINSDVNYTGNGIKFAFGNSNAGTNYGTLKWNGNELNKYNNKGYLGCTFQLVTGIDAATGLPLFNGGINAPKIFGETSQAGKSVYTNSSLTFDRVGDTYTLEAVNVNGNVTGGLNLFGHPGKYNGTNGNKTIWTNHFWPLDQITNKDPKFGETGKPVKTTTQKDGKTVALPDSDDGTAHNSYFGMQYSIEFQYDKDYTGPLDYMFFGDDDMWVFLDGTLIADIGGVHSSVGEYVNLWDWLTPAEAGKTHTLSVFYTERGASGSTCYMQFTLPSVKSISPMASRKSLEISKTVDGPETNTAFPFTLTLSNAAVNETYSYYICNSAGVVKSDTVSSNGTLNFQLKGGEYLQINNLAENISYTVTETPTEGYDTTVKVNGTDQTGYTASGTVGDRTQVAYTNHASYTLPETGGAGTQLLYTCGGLAGMAVLLMYGYGIRRRRRRAS